MPSLSLERTREVLSIYDDMTARAIPKPVCDQWIASILDVSTEGGTQEPPPEYVFTEPTIRGYEHIHPESKLWMSMDDILKYIGVPEYARTVGTQRSLTTKALKLIKGTLLANEKVQKTTIPYLSKSQRTYFSGYALAYAEYVCREWWSLHQADPKPDVLGTPLEPIEPVELPAEIVEEFMQSTPEDDIEDDFWIGNVKVTVLQSPSTQPPLMFL